MGRQGALHPIQRFGDISLRQLQLSQSARQFDVPGAEDQGLLPVPASDGQIAAAAGQLGLGLQEFGDLLVALFLQVKLQVRLGFAELSKTQMQAGPQQIAIGAVRVRLHESVQYVEGPQ